MKSIGIKQHIPAIFLSVMLALALLPMPFGYYQVLRIASFAWLGWNCLMAYEFQMPKWCGALGIGAVVYNPFYRLALGREIWSVVNVATIVLIVAWAVANKTWRKEKE